MAYETWSWGDFAASPSGSGGRRLISRGLFMTAATPIAGGG